MNIDDILDDDNKKPVKRRSRGDDYVNNKDFSAAVSQYVIEANNDRAHGQEPRRLPDYIATCFLKIANGLSRSPNFASYSYREDMVMDAVENCIKAVYNYDIGANTRGGLPNAFGYFTQISYYAFLRRIAKEKRQFNIKKSLMEKGGLHSFVETDDQNGVGENIVEKIRQRNDDFYKPENECNVEQPIQVAKKNTKNKSEGPLQVFF